MKTFKPRWDVRIKPRLCQNVEPGTYGHECGKPAAWIGRTPAGNKQYFCDRCRGEGYEANMITDWRKYYAD